MRKFLILATGIYLILAGLFITFLAVAMIPAALKSSAALPAGVNMGRIMATYSPFILWLVVSGIGIILKKNWARYSLFILSVISIIMGIILIFAFLGKMYTTADKSISVFISGSLFSLMAAFIFIGLPVFFLAFFNKGDVKEVFGSKDPAGNKIERPLGVTVISVISIISAAFSVTPVLYPLGYAIPFFNMLLSGNALRFYFLLNGLIYLYLGVNLFKMRMRGWWTAVLYYIFNTAAQLVNLLTLSQETLRQMMPDLTPQQSQISLPVYRISASISLLIPLAILIYLILKKKSFEKGGNRDRDKEDSFT
ncbi:MAG: hypothetical protein WC510_03610 [Candidatus Omnitrophota bacterium]